MTARERYHEARRSLQDAATRVDEDVRAVIAAAWQLKRAAAELHEADEIRALRRRSDGAAVVVIRGEYTGPTLARFESVDEARAWIDETRVAYRYADGVAIEHAGLYDFGDGEFREWP